MILTRRAAITQLSLFGVWEISGLQPKSHYRKRSRAAVIKRRRSMITKFSSSFLVALLLVPLLVTSTTARPRINDIAGRSHSNAIEGRQIAAPPWSAACMTDHGPSECGEPIWIYGSRGEIARYRDAF